MNETRFRRALRRMYMDAAARGFRVGARRLAWDLKRGFGRTDRRLLMQYMREHATRKLHVGCGNRLLSGWLNADLAPSSPLVFHLDATKPFPIAAETFDYVFSEHMIEHVSHAHGTCMVAECHRVLKKGGVVRISTPDLQFLANLLTARDSSTQREYLDWAIASLGPDATLAAVINQFFREWGHQFIYDEPTLRATLSRAGFSAIIRCELQHSAHELLRNLENESRLPPGFLRLETFTLEATKG